MYQWGNGEGVLSWKIEVGSGKWEGCSRKLTVGKEQQ